MDVEQAVVTESSGFTKSVAVLVGLAAVLAALLTVAESQTSRQEQRALLFSARLAAAISGVIPATSAHASFQTGAAREAVGWQARGTARVLAATQADAEQLEIEMAVGEATTAAGERLMTIAEGMAEVPSEDEVDRFTAAVLKDGLQRAQTLSKQQNDAVDLAEAAGARSSRFGLALSVLAVAAVLLGFAGAIGAGRPGVVALVAGGLFLLLSGGIGATGLVL